MSASNGQGITIARPTIEVDGRDVPALGEGLLGLLIDETLAGLYRCEAVFGNWGMVNGTIDYLYFDRRTLEFGKPFKVKRDDDVIFDGRIMALEGQFPADQAPTITVLAEDRFQDLRMTRRTRTYTDVTDTDVIRQIASDHGLQADVDMPETSHVVLAQVNQSDLAFLRELVRAADTELWMDGSRLLAKQRSSRGDATLRLTYGQDLKEFSALADLANQRTSVAVSGWDVSAKAAITHEATESLIQGELNGDVSGVSILQQTLGARKEALAHTVPFTTNEAQVEAEAFFRMSARQFVVGRGTADTAPELRVGSLVELVNLGKLFNGSYYLTEVRHLFDGSFGMRTEFTGERAGVGRV